ncbi:MAG: hypothetical protein EPO52_15320 [Herbiconiux sp.]|nr:MAG: hypothetical protein EPO52_15320 [Herbiconiux sp.]
MSAAVMRTRTSETGATALSQLERELLERVQSGLGVAGSWMPSISGATFDVQDPATGLDAIEQLLLVGLERHCLAQLSDCWSTSSSADDIISP